MVDVSLSFFVAMSLIATKLATARSRHALSGMHDTISPYSKVPTYPQTTVYARKQDNWKLESKEKGPLYFKAVLSST